MRTSQFLTPLLTVHNGLLLYRGRSPQPPAEEEEEDFDDTLAAIDTCKL